MNQQLIDNKLMNVTVDVIQRGRVLLLLLLQTTPMTLLFLDVVDVFLHLALDARVVADLLVLISIHRSDRLKQLDLSLGYN